MLITAGQLGGRFALSVQRKAIVGLRSIIFQLADRAIRCATFIGSNERTDCPEKGSAIVPIIVKLLSQFLVTFLAV